MPKKILVLGGFEKSGHDVSEEVIYDLGVRKNLIVSKFRWREHVDICNHPIFNVHRFAASRGLPDISGLLDEDWISATLAKELSHYIAGDYDSIISVHPWSSYVAGESLLEKKDTSTLLIDYTAEYSYFPTIQHPRIDKYLGAGPIFSIPLKTRLKCSQVGIAVRDNFYCNCHSNIRENRLVVASGSDGWAINSMSPAVKRLAGVLNPENILLLAPNDFSRKIWQKEEIPHSEILMGISNIAPLLKESKWYLSKSGGIAVTEGLAADCVGFISESKVFWENDAFYRLCSQGIVQDPLRGNIIPDISNHQKRSEAREKSLRAAKDIIDHANIYRRDYNKMLVGESAKILARDINAYDSNGKLPLTTKKLIERINHWLIDE